MVSEKTAKIRKNSAPAGILRAAACAFLAASLFLGGCAASGPASASGSGESVLQGGSSLSSCSESTAETVLSESTPDLCADGDGGAAEKYSAGYPADLPQAIRDADGRTGVFLYDRNRGRLTVGRPVPYWYCLLAGRALESAEEVPLQSLAEQLLLAAVSIDDPEDRAVILYSLSPLVKEGVLREAVVRGEEGETFDFLETDDAGVLRSILRRTTTEERSGISRISCEYDGEGRLLRIGTDGTESENGRPDLVFSWSSAGELEKMIRTGDPQLTWTVQRTEDGRIREIACEDAPEGRTSVLFTYDEKGRIAGCSGTLPESDLAEFVFDGEGRFLYAGGTSFDYLLPGGYEEKTAVSVRMERFYSGRQEYALLYGLDRSDEPVWVRSTGAYEMTELEQVGEIGSWNDRFYYYAGGTVYAVRISDGGQLWANPDFQGASAVSDIGPDGTIYMCGYYEPDLFVTAAEGWTKYRIRDMVFTTFWPSGVEYDPDTNQIRITMEGDFEGSGDRTVCVVDAATYGYYTK